MASQYHMWCSGIRIKSGAVSTLVPPRTVTALALAQARHVSTSSIARHSSRSATWLPELPAWTLKDDLGTAKKNALARKSGATEEDFARLEQLRTMIKSLDASHRQLIIESSKLQAEVQSKMKAGRNKSKEEVEEARKAARKSKQEVGRSSKALLPLQNEVREILLRLPNSTHPDVPLGDEDQAVVIGKGGNAELLPREMQTALGDLKLPRAVKETPALEGKPEAERDHLSIASQQGWIDWTSMGLIAGSGWAILKGPLATLEHALVSYGMSKACQAEFSPVVIPDVVNKTLLDRTGFSPREGGGGQTYWISPDGKEPSDNGPQQLALAATAEIPLAGMFAGMRFESKGSLPKTYVASSHAFRAEAGARGAESRGLYRLHQFTKVELYVVCLAEQSEEWLEKLREVQEDVIGGLGLPYRVLDMPTEELGASAYRKYDIEVWMPGRGKWGEVSSASNCTDYQARRLGIQCKAPPSQAGQSKNVYAHTLNGTAIAVPRIIVALIENYGVSPQGKLRLPAVLKRHWGEYSPQDQVEWLGENLAKEQHNQANSVSAFDKAQSPKSSKQSAMQSALERIRRASAESGTDPASMVLSFLILHELTALAPIIFFFYLLGLLGAGEQVMSWLMQVSEDDKSSIRAWLRTKIDEGMLRAERFGRKWGLFGFRAGSRDEMATAEHTTAQSAALVGTFANIVAAYAITKALLPLRIAACFTLAGPFARVFIEPVKRFVAKRGIRRGGSSK